MHVDLSRSSPPCMGPLNSVIATTRSAIYIAMKHIFPDVPLNAGTFEPIHIKDPDGTFLYAKYPRPVSGCAAEVSQRLCEAVFVTLAQVIPDKLFAAPAGTSGNFALGGHDPVKNRNYVMYIFSGGGYGGWHSGDGISNGCSTIGISKTQPLEVMEQFYPVLFEEYSLREGSGGAGKNRGGFGVNYRVRLRRGHAIASFVMDHGREGPQGVQGGADGGPNDVTVRRQDQADYRLPHFSKDQGLHMREGDLVLVGTPGGGGFGKAKERDPERVRADVALGYYSAADAAAKFGVAVDAAGKAVDAAKTAALRAKMA
jgi:N-methylhydantoinase B